MTASHPFIKRTKIGQISQGTIFNGAVAENYNNCVVYGLVITARCDIAHSKILTYNYLPIVRFEDWLNYDFKVVFLSRLEKQKMGELLNIFKKYKISQNLIRHFEKRSLKSKLSQKITTQKDQKRFISTIDMLSLIDDCKNNNKDNNLLPKIIRQNEKLTKGMYNELIQHKLNGYYYLEEISTDQSFGKHYIIILREIRNIDRYIAEKISIGLSQSNMPTAQNLNFTHNDIIMPISDISSPYIEHIMQCFSNLYVRIGVDDISAEITNELYDIILDT